MEYDDISFIFPRPKEYEHLPDNEQIILGELGSISCIISVSENASLLEMEAAKLVSEKIKLEIGISPITCKNYILDINCDINRDSKLPVIIICTLNNSVCNNLLEFQKKEAYQLKIGLGEVVIYCNEGIGAYYGAQTLIQLMKVQNNFLTLPACIITDWPDTEHRGLFVENRYGTDRMKLQDWKDMIDYMALLKMNFLSVAVYGCWCIQYGNEISEYLYLPVKKYPDLLTRRKVRYYSNKKGTWETIDYLPDMYESDFFGELIEYSKSKNIIVRPQFNSLGHNTLIPRLYPEVSARDEENGLSGFGLCTSNEKTYEFLFGIYDEIINRYLAPNNIDWFHIGLDEVMEMIGIDPEQPWKRFDPWCKCENCMKYSHKELLVNHLIKLAKHLRSKGIKNISIWHDQLLKMNLINESFVDRLKAEDLYDYIIINWWRYGTEVFETTKPELGVRTFITPMAGYYHWSIVNSYLINIYKMTKLAGKDRVEGIEAYCTYDYSYDRNYHCLAEYMWNTSCIEELETFRDRYIKKNFSLVYERAKIAFQYYDKFTEPGEKFQMIFINLSYYHYTYVRDGKDYPRNFPGEVFQRLYENIEKSKDILSAVLEDSTKAYEVFDELSREFRSEYKLLDYYKAVCLTYRVLANEFLALVELNDAYNSFDSRSEKDVSILSLIKMIVKIKSLILDRKKQMLIVEETKASYLLPSELRNFSIYLQYLIDIETHFVKILDGIYAGDALVAPFINFMDTRDIESEIFRLIR